MSNIAQPFPPAGLANLKSIVSNMNLDGPASAEAFQYLSPDMLLEFCAMKLRGLDEQVKTAFASQERRNEISTALSNLTNALTTHKQFSGEEGAQDLIAEYDKAIAKIGADTDMGQKLIAERDKLFASAGDGPGNEGSNEVATEEMARYADVVGRLQGDVNRDGELAMIKLQSLMSQRQQSLTMFTNIISGIGQTNMAIAQNTGK